MQEKKGAKIQKTTALSFDHQFVPFNLHSLPCPLSTSPLHVQSITLITLHSTIASAQRWPLAVSETLCVVSRQFDPHSILLSISIFLATPPVVSHCSCYSPNYFHFSHFHTRLFSDPVFSSFPLGPSVSLSSPLPPSPPLSFSTPLCSPFLISPSLL